MINTNLKGLKDINYLIIPDTFVRDFKLENTDGKVGNNPTSVVAFGDSQAIEHVSESLLKKLSVFADVDQISGQTLPDELESLVDPGKEVRIYFSSGERTIRLTVRRKNDGSWLFGDTAYDLLTIDENYKNYSYGRYTLNEINHLESSEFEGSLPAARLRDHMSNIRNILMNGLVNMRFQGVQKDWRKSIPEDVDSAVVVELLLADQNQYYHLDRGFVNQRINNLSETQKKTLAAIKYLAANKLVFWSKNAGSSGIKEGIYKQGEVKPSTLWMAGYDFVRAIFDSMETLGVEYTDGDWTKKAN
ncbi:MAG: hypothetical protein H6625_13080 [Bdellovibrionaceae bacterium]|nr:hypothetical protein [Pseudobdellovibrionaceae bacterium]